MHTLIISNTRKMASYTERCMYIVHVVNLVYDNGAYRYAPITQNECANIYRGGGHDVAMAGL